MVFDPPHVSEQSPKGQVNTRQAFSTHGKWDVCDLFPGFLREARRILAPNGIVLCKIADQVHRSASRWQHVRLMLDAEKVGFTMCDLIVKGRAVAIMGAWKNAYHARKYHCFCVVLRKGRC